MFVSILKYLWVRLPSFRGLFYKPKKNSYLFLPINGAGLGHLTRCLAIAKRLRGSEPEAEIVFLTTSIGVPLVHREGFSCHHVTPAALVNTGAVSWNRLFYETLRSVLDIHNPSTLIFDGTVPYLGLRRAMHSFRRIDYVWVKRGLYKDGVDRKKIDAMVKGFRTVISPGELGAEEGFSPKHSSFHSVEPISLLDPSDLIDRSLARRMLRLDLNRPCAYVQLGAGNINGIADVQDRIVSILRNRGIQVVVGQSPIAIRAKPELSADSVIVDYPNSKYFAAFDFAVLAGGYNSVCEAVTLGLPAVFFPNTETGADDQLKRVLQAQAFGPYEVIKEFDDMAFLGAVEKLLASEKSAFGNPGKRNGAVSAAALIAQG